MPKNAHPPRGNASKKPAPKPAEEDTSFIEFTNKKGNSKKNKKPDAEVKQEGPSKGKGKGNEPSNGAAEDAPKKPDTRTLIGGASWTGKLPVNMLSEHCQKQKWEKPDYSMVHEQVGIVRADILIIICKEQNRTRLRFLRHPQSHAPEDARDYRIASLPTTSRVQRYRSPAYSG